MFKPHVTVACVVHAEGKFLVVEETINGKALWNQPAGHLEADETLVEAAARELRKNIVGFIEQDHTRGLVFRFTPGRTLRAESLNLVISKRSFLHGIFRDYELPHYSLITRIFHDGKQ